LIQQLFAAAAADIQTRLFVWKVSIATNVWLVCCRPAGVPCTLYPTLLINDVSYRQIGLGLCIVVHSSSTWHIFSRFSIYADQPAFISVVLVNRAWTINSS